MLRKESQASKNLWWFVFAFLGIILGFLILFLCDVISLPKESDHWYNSKEDTLILGGTVFAILGAIWAVLARIDASKAFIQSKETHDAISNTFQFRQIYNDDMLTGIYKKIGDEDVTITLFLHFPIVGLFSEGEKFKQDANLSFTLLIKKLTDLQSFDNRKFKINIACYTKEFTHEFLKGAEWDAQRASVDDFYDLLERLNDKYKFSDKFKRFYFNNEFGLRIALINNSMDDSGNLGLVWTISDFTPKEKGKFTAASFKTKDQNSIDTLDEIFKNFYERAIEDQTITLTTDYLLGEKPVTES